MAVRANYSGHDNILFSENLVMKPCKSASHRSSTQAPRRECARDSIADVDPMRIDVHIGNHSEVPLEHWQDQLKEKRRKRGPRPAKPETPTAPSRQPPDALIDDYAGPHPA